MDAMGTHRECGSIYRRNISLRVYQRRGDMAADLEWLVLELLEYARQTLIYVPTKKLAASARAI